MKSKYIVLKDAGKGGVPIAIVFPELIHHREVARAFGGKSRVLGAGFVSVSISIHSEQVVEAYGRSASLNIPSRPEDTELVKQALGVI